MSNYSNCEIVTQLDKLIYSAKVKMSLLRIEIAKRFILSYVSLFESNGLFYFTICLFPRFSGWCARIDLADVAGLLVSVSGRFKIIRD